MDSDFINKLSELAFLGFFDPSKKMVVVHFFNDSSNSSKNDIIAYLLPDMQWDVREIISEESTLHPDHESVLIGHNPISVEPQDSVFDKFIRKGLEAQATYADEGDHTIIMDILEKNAYDIS